MRGPPERQGTVRGDRDRDGDGGRARSRAGKSGAGQHRQGQREAHGREYTMAEHSGCQSGPMVPDEVMESAYHLRFVRGCPGREPARHILVAIFRPGCEELLMVVRTDHEGVLVLNPPMEGICVAVPQHVVCLEAQPPCQMCVELGPGGGEHTIGVNPLET